MGSRVIVCGGRDWNDVVLCNRTLDEINSAKGIDLVATGGATGADSIANNWAQDKGIALAVFKPNWKVYGKAAGPIRNQWMLEFVRPDFVVAFQGGRGTDDMVTRARSAGVRIIRPSE
jgi:predicted Rossmann-fold nucleotide-binding protein